MSKTESAASSKTLLQRVNHAWEPLKSSFSFHLFFATGIVELLAAMFDWYTKLKENDLWPPWAPTLNIFVCGAITIFFLRALFLLAERCGEAEEKLTASYRAVESNVNLVSCIHDAIHETRNSLLADNGFLKLMVPDDDDAKFLLNTWATQLGLIQKGMRSLTNSDCNICLKLIKKDGFQIGVDGLVTVCYSPAVSSERRKNSRILPINQGIAQEAIVTKSIAVCQDILEDDRFWPREQKDVYGKQYRTVLASPILVDREARGVLCFDWSEPNKYNETHRHAIACFTDLVSTACYLRQLARSLVQEHEGGA